MQVLVVVGTSRFVLGHSTRSCLAGSADLRCSDTKRITNPLRFIEKISWSCWIRQRLPNAYLELCDFFMYQRPRSERPAYIIGRWQETLCFLKQPTSVSQISNYDGTERDGLDECRRRSPS
ncbi:hypothetical protein BD779DRAFT_348242 [Infundibulicybe gibba]|nr:hypothetical protein BD779DRAFT_348242 [Infundibulicybe gibba]